MSTSWTNLLVLIDDQRAQGTCYVSSQSTNCVDSYNHGIAGTSGDSKK